MMTARSLQRIGYREALTRALNLGLVAGVLETPHGLARAIQIEHSDKHGVADVPIRKSDLTVSAVQLDNALDRCTIERKSSE